MRLFRLFAKIVQTVLVAHFTGCHYLLATIGMPSRNYS